MYIRYVRTHHRASTSLGVHFLYSRGFSTTFFTSRVNYGTSYHATTSSRRVYPSSLYSRSLLPFPPCRYTGGLVFQSILPLGFLFFRYIDHHDRHYRVVAGSSLATSFSVDYALSSLDTGVLWEGAFAISPSQVSTFSELLLTIAARLLALA